ncbi:DUF6077 domain-containing protein [Butyrivibrio proteoclasticus]|uniref:DUF6077 domain-containing protein n=1 Tax=Butyrivibrio proteoclasticus TaxID=43305 RepID=UPI00047AC065|nr:DUF6077 domain-containing protein [Butyrivibrio proteoclasticus]
MHLLVLWLLIIPFLIGILFNFILPVVRRTVGITFILGYLVYFGCFEVVAIPCMLKITYNAFSYCTKYYTIISLVLAAAGLIRGLWVLKRDGFNVLSLFPGETHAGAHELLSPRSDPKMLKMNYSLESNIYWGIFFVLLMFQMVMSVVMSSFDGDDAYFVVESLLAQQADVMNTILPYTGTSTSLDIRHALAVITMWIAFIARQSGIHATIVSHSVIPCLVIALVYLVYVEIARILFRRRQEIIPVFMIIISFLMIFGNVSIYTNATFFLTRTWQGKAIACNQVFPLIFWVFLWMLEDTGHFHSTNPAKTVSDDHYMITPWVMLTLINMLAGVCTSLGIFFGGGIIALLTLILLFFSRRWTVLVGAVLCEIPSVIYLLLYLSIWGG